MQLLLLIAALATFINLAVAAVIEPPPRYYLQTEVVGVGPDCGSDKQGLWVYSYHTGAGLGDAALSVNKSSAMEAYLNGTQQLFTYPGNLIGPWPLSLLYYPYTTFRYATISIAATNPQDQGFFFNETGLQLNGSSRGWLACDWWHGVPQLFNLNSYSYGPLPKSCSRINLLPVAV